MIRVRNRRLLSHRQRYCVTDFDKVIEEAKSEILHFESWEKLTDETSRDYAAFCVFRDLGAERNIRKAAEISLNGNAADKNKIEKRYRSWRNSASQFRWKERAADYDRYLEKLKAAELRKTIEAQGEKHRAVTGKMLDVVSKKLDMMNPEDLTQNMVTEWVQTAIKADREIGQFTDANCLGVSTGRNSTPKQGEFNFVSDFQGL